MSSLSDYLYQLWHGKSRYTPDEQLVVDARRKKTTLLRHAATYTGVNSMFIFMNYLSNDLSSFWAGYIMAAWGFLLVPQALRYFLWRAEHNNDIAHAQKKLQLLQDAEIKLLERSALSKAATKEKVNPQMIFKIAVEQSNKAKTSLDKIDSIYSGDIRRLIDQNLEHLQQMNEYLQSVEEYLAEEDLSILAREQMELEKRLLEVHDQATKTSLQASLELISERTTKMKELSIESDRIRASMQSALQVIENLRAQATQLQAPSDQQHTQPDKQLKDSVYNLKRELETMQKVKKELDQLEMTPVKIHEALKQG